VVDAGMVDPDALLTAQHDFRLRLCVMPPFIPSVSLYHDDDVGLGHVLNPLLGAAGHFYDMPVMGPNRIGLVGIPMSFYGGRSYSVGGALASGHTWNVYLIDPLDPEGVDRTHAGVLQAGFPMSGDIITWTPTAVGTYRIELQLANRHTTFNTDGFRFIRVFDDDIDGDLQEVTEVSGSGSIDDGGYELTVTYRPSGLSEVVQDWSRVIVNIDTYYEGVNNTFDSEGPSGIPTVQFNGVVIGDTISENLATETITFKMVSPSKALARVPLRGYLTPITDPGPPPVSLEAEYPLMFADPNQVIKDPSDPSDPGLNAVEFAKSDDINFPVHEVTSGDGGLPIMTYTHPLYHILQMHINLAKWFDVELIQESRVYLYPITFPTHDFWSLIKARVEQTLGNAYCTKKGALRIGPDKRFQSEDWWLSTAPPPIMDLNRENVSDISVQNDPFKVTQVVLRGMNEQNSPYWAKYPQYAEFVGQPYDRASLLIPSLAIANTWAQRLFQILNRPYDVGVTVMGLNRALEVEDVVTITYRDKAERLLGL
jgi:hypothetical protein